jgi:phospholipid/cholesterol/gamma-HCH transport system substrate-binding protein
VIDVRISHAMVPALRVVTIAVFGAVCVVIFGYLWVNSGGKIPLLSKAGYQVSVDLPKVANLVKDSDVMVAGVKIGSVDRVEVRGDHAHVTMRLAEHAPLRTGATVQVRQKTLVEETFLEVTDGTGAELPSGSTLPPGSGKPATQLNDVLTSLDQGTRDALADSVRSLGRATKDTDQSLSDTFTGLGALGREGEDVLAALREQSADLEQLTGHTAALLAALNTRQGEIATMVDNASQLAKVTAGGADQVRAVVRQLPGLLSTAQDASGSLEELATTLAPVAADLDAAAPKLSTALSQLPETTARLRALLPTVDGVLIQAPATLTRTPGFAENLSRMVPGLKVALGDVNPMLGFLEPYGRDVAAWFTNFGATLIHGDVNGKFFRFMAVLNEQSLKNLPLNTQIGPLNKFNPYPAPGSGTNPGPWDGDYPRVEEEPVR